MVQAARRVAAKDANEELAHRRLTVLEVAERLAVSASLPVTAVPTENVL
jgi:hypothetical protein